MSTASKNPRFTLTRPLCPQCVKLQEEIERLREENDRLKAQSRYQQRQIDEGYFGSSTPSSKKPFKPNTTAERNNGGGRVGHRGYGRTVRRNRRGFRKFIPPLAGRDQAHRLYHWADACPAAGQGSFDSRG